jgi:hypothetical protein
LRIYILLHTFDLRQIRFCVQHFLKKTWKFSGSKSKESSGTKNHVMHSSAITELNGQKWKESADFLSWIELELPAGQQIDSSYGQCGRHHDGGGRGVQAVEEDILGSAAHRRKFDWCCDKKLNFSWKSSRTTWRLGLKNDDNDDDDDDAASRKWHAMHVAKTDNSIALWKFPHGTRW